MMTWGQCATETTNPANACAVTGSGPAAAAPLGVASATAREDERGAYPGTSVPATGAATAWRVAEVWDMEVAPSTSIKAVIDVVRVYRARGHRVRLNFTLGDRGRVVGLEMAVTERADLAVAAAAVEAERADQAHATAEQWGGA